MDRLRLHINKYGIGSSCSILFIAFVMPFFCGQMLIMQISIIRIVTTKKSATSQQISNWKILAMALTSFGAFALIYTSYFALHLISHNPYSFFVEVCFNPDKEQRVVPKLKAVFFILPFLLIIAVTMITDVMLIRFLQKVIMPINAPPSLGVNGPGNKN